MTNGVLASDNPHRVRLDGSLNLGTFIHLGVLLVAVVLAWAAFDRRTTVLEIQVTEQGKEIIEIRKQTNRIERYLQASDKAYWKKLKQNGEDVE